MNTRKNIIANYLGSGWSALVFLIVLPIYITFMGIESYGMVGFLGMVLSMFGILDLGLEETLKREMAWRSSRMGQEQEMRDLLRTFEVIYWSVAVVLGTLIFVMSAPIAQYWIHSQQLSSNDVQRAVALMGGVVVLRWPFGLYYCGLLGLQKQVLVNKILVVSATFRGVGAVMVLWLISPTIQAFFLWQIVTTGLETFAVMFFLWRSLPKANSNPKVKLKLIDDVKRFASGMFGLKVVVMASQSDKIMLSTILPLGQFGYYMLAWNLAATLQKIVSPIVSAIYPKVVGMATEMKDVEIAPFYHKYSQLVSAILCPLTAVLVCYSHEILLMWTGDLNLTLNTDVTLKLLVIGIAFDTFTAIPVAFQLAYGWTSLSVFSNLAKLILLIPSLYWLVRIYGMEGAALVWMVLNGACLFISVTIMHWRMMIGQMYQWVAVDLLKPLILIFALVCGIHSVIPTVHGRIYFLVYITMVVSIAFLICMLTLPIMKEILEAELARISLLTRRNIAKVFRCL